jgi:hypothetical protein
LLKVIEKHATVGYRALASALGSLACQRNQDDFELIKSFTADQGRGAIVKGGAIAAIGLFASMESYEFLLSSFQKSLAIGEGIQSGEPERALSPLINALANAALYQAHDKSIRIKVVGLLRDALRDPRADIQKDIIHALVKLEDHGSAGLMQNCKSAFAVQDWPFVEKKISGMNAGGVKSMTDMNKRVEELEGKLRTLEFKVKEKEKEAK